MKFLYKGMKKVFFFLRVWNHFWGYEKVSFGYEENPIFAKKYFHTLGYENIGCFSLMLRGRRVSLETRIGTPKLRWLWFFRLCHMSSVRSTSDGRGPVTHKRVPDREEQGKPIKDARRGRCPPPWSRFLAPVDDTVTADNLYWILNTTGPSHTESVPY